MDEHLLETAMGVAKGANPAEWLRLADRYIVNYNKDPKHFVLPKNHKDMLPVIEEYAYDLRGFVGFIAKVRDLCRRDDAEAVQKLYRTVNGRLTQQERRARFDRALDKAQELHGPYADYLTRMQWLSALEQVWRKRRLRYLDEARDAAGRRLTRDEVAEAAAKFWAELDEEIEAGNVPDWDIPNWPENQENNE